MQQIQITQRRRCSHNSRQYAALQLQQALRPVSHHHTRCTVLAGAATASASPPRAAAAEAVVLGAGMSGLVIAKVLSKHFDRVTVIERDDIPASWPEQPATAAAETKGARRGVTQYNHLHVLAGKGLLTLDALFEGRFISSLQASGAVLSDVVTRFANYHPAGGRWALPTRAAKGPVLMCQATRHLVEGVTRQLLHDNTPGVDVRYNTTVAGLVLQQEQEEQQQQQQEGASHSKQQRVTGVKLQSGAVLHADLVVDCTGRQSKMPQWLAAAGLPVPRVSQVDASLGYASWLVKLDPQVAARTLQGTSGLYAIAAWPETVGAAIVAVEGGMHMAALCTYADQTPPFEDAHLTDFMAKQAWNPAVSEVLVGAARVSPVSRFYRVSSTWRHYEELPLLPQGLIVTADSVCSFNPVYGHGMTVAAMQAAKLDELLGEVAAASGGAAAAPVQQRQWLEGFSQRYQQAITPIIQRVWDLSTGGDLRYSSTSSTEPASAAASFMNAYFDTLMVLAAKDPEVSEALLRVMHLIDETSALTSPRMLAKVARHFLLTAPFAVLARQQPGGRGGGGGAAASSGEATNNA